MGEKNLNFKHINLFQLGRKRRTIGIVIKFQFQLDMKKFKYIPSGAPTINRAILRFLSFWDDMADMKQLVYNACNEPFDTI